MSSNVGGLRLVDGDDFAFHEHPVGLAYVVLFNGCVLLGVLNDELHEPVIVLVHSSGGNSASEGKCEERSHQFLLLLKLYYY